MDDYLYGGKGESVASRALCPRPECGEPVDASRSSATFDARERAWHADCARGALADYFRTPPDLERLDGARVEFTVGDGRLLHAHLVESECWTAPHDFLLHAVTFDGDVEVGGLFIGAENALGNVGWDCAFVSGDRADGAIRTYGQVVHAGLYVTIQCRPHLSGPQKLICKLIGERFDPKRRRPNERMLSTVAGLKIEAPIDPGATASAAFCWYLSTHGEEMACDDWRDWEVVKVEVGGGPGRAAEEVRTLPMGVALTGRLTPLPTFAARPGEPVRYHLKNHAKVARLFKGRVYGVGTYGAPPKREYSSDEIEDLALLR